MSADAKTAAPVRTKRRVVEGVVSSDKMDKTIKVTVVRALKHPKYEKRVRRPTVYTAHDEKNEAKAGDLVEITETRRLSATKSWRLTKIIRRAE